MIKPLHIINNILFIVMLVFGIVSYARNNQFMLAIFGSTCALTFALSMSSIISNMRMKRVVDYIAKGKQYINFDLFLAKVVILLLILISFAQMSGFYRFAGSSNLVLIISANILNFYFDFRVNRADRNWSKCKQEYIEKNGQEAFDKWMKEDDEFHDKMFNEFKNVFKRK